MVLLFTFCFSINSNGQELCAECEECEEEVGEAEEVAEEDVEFTADIGEEGFPFGSTRSGTLFRRNTNLARECD